MNEQLDGVPLISKGFWTAVMRSPLHRCVFVERMSIAHQTHRETIAEHQWLCALYAWTLYWSAPEYCIQHEVDLGDLLQRALFHDIEEIFTGDIPKPVKMRLPIYASEALKRVQSEEVQSMLKGIGEHGRYLYAIWLKAKLGAAGSIVALADYMGMVSMVARELQLGNSLAYLDPISVREYIRLLREDPFLAPWHTALTAANEYLANCIGDLRTEPWGDLKEVLLQS